MANNASEPAASEGDSGKTTSDGGDCDRNATSAIVGSTRRGRLKIFFGYSSYVGTVKSMLAAAADRRAKGERVLFASQTGLVDLDPAGTHADPVGDDANSVPFAVDDALRAEPDLLLLPFLAGRNPGGSRHRMRYRDVEELQAAGIDVWTTLEVGQIESLAEFVERVLGRRAFDRVPDSIFDSADEVELIDLSPEVLHGANDRSTGPRSTHHDVQDPAPGRAALLALREVALRKAADRLRATAGSDPVEGLGEPPVGPTEDRLVVCVGPSPTSARVIRAASRMARAMRAPWTAVTIEPTRETTAENKQRVVRHLQLAESLGASVTTLTGHDIAREVIEYARAHDATKIIIGKTRKRRMAFGLRPSIVDRIISGSGEVDVYVIRGADAGQDSLLRSPTRKRIELRTILGPASVLAATTAVAALFGFLGFSDANLVLAYILGVTAVAAWYGRGPAIAASIGGVLLYNFFFTEPRFTLRVHDSGYIVTFAVMMTIGLLVSTLTTRVREQSIAARRRERRTEQLYEFSRDLSSTSGSAQIATVAAARLSVILGAGAVVLLPNDRGDLTPVGAAWRLMNEDDDFLVAAEWAYKHGERAGYGSETHEDVPAILLPLMTAEEALGVLAVMAAQPEDLLLPEGRRLLETCAAQVVAALQRDRLVETIHRTISQAESERVRAAMLSSVSHDFRTPLSAIAGTASSLLETGDQMDDSERTSLLQSLHQEAVRLSRLVDSLLQITRLEAGQACPNREWNVVEDIVGAALTRMQKSLASHRVVTRIPGELPMIRVDGGLIELILTNLLENATRYAEAGTEIVIAARTAADVVEIEVADQGPGLTTEDRARAFEKFYRGARWRSDGSRGAGLGLAICAAVAKLHDGSIAGINRLGGGASFVLALPLEEQPPDLDASSPNREHEEGWT